jgi:hypothetical protein
MAFSHPRGAYQARGAICSGRGFHHVMAKPATPPPVAKGFSAQDKGFARHFRKAGPPFLVKRRMGKISPPPGFNLAASG